MFTIKLSLFGDSILKGVVTDKNRRYRLIKQENEFALDDDLTVTLVNQSRFGSTVTKGEQTLKRFLDKGTDSRVMLLEYGGNDCDYNWREVAKDPYREHQPNTPLNQFVATYERIISLLRSKQIRPVLMNLPPIDAVRYFNTIVSHGCDADNVMAWLGDVQMIYRYQELYSDTVERISRQNDTLLVDVRSSFLRRHDLPDLLSEDGIHPSEAGHRLMRDVTRDYMQRNRKMLLEACT